ncbi:hypothetical protein [Massilia alkalitolerans]|uniref:hypothetical protein n=1 Tax=Massilia alkalitolerans TaxID=286638 RepID=UPI000488D971|nr:hypothetical protein [Massilia alkalitolerans]
MSKHPTTISVPAYRRIIDAGHDIHLQHKRHSYCIQLVRRFEVVASVECSRTGNLSRAGVIEKAKMDAFGPSSSVYKAMQLLAMIAEANAAAGV